jgi:hypothetical protein
VLYPTNLIILLWQATNPHHSAPFDSNPLAFCPIQHMTHIILPYHRQQSLIILLSPATNHHHSAPTRQQTLIILPHKAKPSSFCPIWPQTLFILPNHSTNPHHSAPLG